MPTSDEWDALINEYGGNSIAAESLLYGKNSGFDVLFAGFRNTLEKYSGLSTYTGFWSSDEYSSEDAYVYTFSLSNSEAVKTTMSKKNAFSVRCIRDY